MERLTELLNAVPPEFAGKVTGFDASALLNGLLARAGVQFPSGVNSITLAEQTTWPYLQQAAGVPWYLLVIGVTILGILTAKSVRVGVMIGGLTLAAMLLTSPVTSSSTLALALVCLIVALLLGLLLGYIHAAYPLARFITWPMLWLLLTLPILGVVAISTGIIAPGGFQIEALLLVAAPLGVMARGSAIILAEVDPELRRQAQRLGAGHAQQVRLLSFPLSAPSLRSVIHNSVMVFFAVMLALGALGLPGVAREIWLALIDKDLGALLVAALQLWALGVAIDLLFRFNGRGRLKRLEEAL